MIPYFPIVMMMRKVAPQPTYSMCGSTGLTWNDVTSPTGKVWMDRSIRQIRIPTSTSDTAGAVLYQWGRLSDGKMLYDINGKKLLLFGDSKCELCKETMPELQKAIFNKEITPILIADVKMTDLFYIQLITVFLISILFTTHLE